MSLSANGKALLSATKDLMLRWQQTQESWQDAKSAEFEKRYLEDLVASVDKAAEVFEQLDRILTKARSDCE